MVDKLRGIHRERAIVADIQAGIGLRCAAGRIAQMLSNLLKNALVHGASARPVTVAAGLDGEHFVLSVWNPGLAPGLVEQLFKPFRRGTLDSAHNGLGRYIVDEIARSHGVHMK